jgi:hypothetical protein
MFSSSRLPFGSGYSVISLEIVVLNTVLAHEIDCGGRVLLAELAKVFPNLRHLRCPVSPLFEWDQNWPCLSSMELWVDLNRFGKDSYPRHGYHRCIRSLIGALRGNLVPSLKKLYFAYIKFADVDTWNKLEDVPLWHTLGVELMEICAERGVELLVASAASESMGVDAFGMGWPRS